MVQESHFDNFYFSALPSLSESGVFHLSLLQAGVLRTGVALGMERLQAGVGKGDWALVPWFVLHPGIYLGNPRA